MKKQFLSKSVPRGTRTIWRYLGALFILFTFAIGNVWADAASWMNNSMTPASYFTLGSNTSAVANAKTISAVNYTHSINMTTKSNQSSNNTNGYFIRFTLTSASNVSVLFGANGGGRSLRINTGWSYDASTNTTQLNNGATPSTGIKATSNQVSNGQYGTVEVSNLAAGTYYICGSGSVSVYKITITSAGGCTAPTSPKIEGTAAYTEGDNISLTASATGATSATFTWYKGADWATASAGSSIGTGATLAINSCATSDAGTYWCNISNGTGCEVQVSKAITVSAASAVCPSGLTISGTKDYTAGETITLNAALESGNGEISYQWYKGSVAAGNAISGATSATFTKANCVAGDAGNYYCVASKTSCSDAVNASAYAVTVATPSYCAELVPATSGEAIAVGDIIDLQTGSNGGTMTATNLGSGNLAYHANGLGFNSKSGPTVKVVLNHNMQVGTKLWIKLMAAGADTRGLTLKTKTGTTISAFTCWVKDVNGATNGDVETFTYTVVAGDGLEGTNEFQLVRNNSVWLQSLKVSNCGAELLDLDYAITPAHDPAYATVTLSKSLVEAGGSATASYSDIDAAYDFDGWEITSGDATIADATAATAAITMGTTASTITLKLKAAEVKYTVTYYDGEESMGTEQVLKDGHPTATGIATRKLGYTFQGWSLTSGGAVKALSEISVTEAMPLYAVYAPVVCPTKGTVFSMSVTDAAATEYNENNAFGLEIGATYTLGIAYSGAKDETKRVGVIDENGEYSFTNNGSVTVKVALDCALAEGDVISFTSSSSKELKIQKVAGTDLYTTSGKKFTIPAESPLIGESVFYLMRGNSGSTFKTITVSRPYTVSFNMNGQSATAIANQKVVAGGKITEPDPAPSVTGQEFGGWYKEAACTNAWDFANDVVSDDVELFAKWTALKSMTLVANGSGEDDVVSYPTVGDPVAVPACPFTYSGYNFVGWTYSPDVTWVDETHFTMPNEDLTLTAQWVDASSVARIGSNYYATLADALAHAADGEIVLLQDINVDAQIEVAAGVSATLDLAGHKIAYTGSTTLTSGVILVHNGASLTINDSSDPDAGSIVSGVNAYAAIALTKAGDNAANPAVLVINGGTLTGHYYGITGNGSRNNTVITINGGTITGTVGIAIYHPQVGTLTVNNGSLTGEDAAIEMRAGTLVINDGTFTATATEFSCNPNGSGSTTSGAAIAIAQHTTKKDISVTINGGTFNGVKALNESNPQVNDPAPQVTMSVTGGNFTGAVSTVDVNNFVSGGSFSEPVAEANCATGYVPETKANGKYGVIVPAQSIDFEAIIDTYGTDATAIAELDAQLAAKHYDIDGTLNDDRLDAPSGKPADKGFKVKKTDLTISFSVEAGKVVEITTGSLSGASIKVNDAAAVAMTASHTHTYYSDDAQAFLITMTAASNKYNIFKSIVIRDPYQVTLDATTNGGEAVAPMYGKMSVILPSATKGTDHFIGWYDRAEEEGRVLVGLADAEYTPTADVTLYAHFAAQSNDGRLSDLQVDGTTVDGFDMDVHIYNLTVPYGTAVSALPKITLATAYDSYAQGVSIYPTDGPEWRADVDGGCYVQQANVTAENGFVVYNQVRTKILPKDMACLVWADVPSANTLTYNATKSLMAEDAVTLAINNVSGTDGPAGVKFQKKGYIKIEMNEGTFKEGDVVALDVTGAAGSTMHVFKVQTPSSEADVIGTGEGSTTPVGVNKVAITEDAAALYLARPNDGTYNGWNPHVDYVAVYRPVPNPLVETINFNGAAAVVDNDLKTITVEVPASTDLATMPVAVTFYSNDPIQTSGAVTGGTWAEGDNEYIVTDKDNDQTVYTVTITKAVPSNDATLETLTYGTPATAITLADGVFEYNVELPYGTSAVPALAATAHHAGANVTEIADAAAFVNRHATSTVTVTAEDGTTTQVYTVNFAISAWKEVAIWDGSTMSAVATSPDATGLAWATTGFSSIANYNTTCGEKSYTKVLPSGGAATSRYMTITVPKDYVAKFYVVMASHSDGSERGMFIGSNLVKDPDATSILELSNNDRDVAVAGMSEIVGEGTYYINPNASIDFQEIRAYVRKGYARTSMLGNGVYGTVCVPNNVAIEDIQGVTVYELMGREPQYGKLAFDEIISGELEAGAPYVFQAHGDKMIMFYGETSVSEPVDKGNGMYGTFEQKVLTELDDVYYFAQKALWSCVDLTSLNLPANRAYVKLSEINYLSANQQNPAPGRRRVTMAVNGEKIATGCENLNVSDKPVKMIINGQLFILRGEKMYDAKGQLVK